MNPCQLVVRLILLILALSCVDRVNASEGVTDGDSPRLAAFNRWAHGFNMGFVDRVVSPTLHGVQLLPNPIRQGLSNFYHTLTEPVSTLSFLMAGETGKAAHSATRFTLNFTVGILGLFDVAEPLGFHADKKHYSEGVCAMGLPLGSYLVVPAVGPSTVGVAGSAIFLMVGSTLALAYLSLEAAIASTAIDLIGSAAALESGASGKPGNLSEQRQEYLEFLQQAGCNLALD